jgi:hypothetical protein
VYRRPREPAKAGRERARQDSNLGPTDYESAALTAELRARCPAQGNGSARPVSSASETRSGKSAAPKTGERWKDAVGRSVDVPLEWIRTRPVDGREAKNAENERADGIRRERRTTPDECRRGSPFAFIARSTNRTSASINPSFLTRAAVARKKAASTAKRTSFSTSHSAPHTPASANRSASDSSASNDATRRPKSGSSARSASDGQRTAGRTRGARRAATPPKNAAAMIEGRAPRGSRRERVHRRGLRSFRVRGRRSALVAGRAAELGVTRAGRNRDHGRKRDDLEQRQAHAQHERVRARDADGGPAGHECESGETNCVAPFADEAQRGEQGRSDADENGVQCCQPDPLPTQRAGPRVRPDRRGRPRPRSRGSSAVAVRSSPTSR